MHVILDTDAHVLFQTHVSVHSVSELVQLALDAQANLSHADFHALMHTWPVHERLIQHINFTDQDLTSAHAVGVHFDSCDFTRAILRDWHATHARFTNCQFAGTILDAGSFEDCDFSGSEFVEAPQQTAHARHVLRPHSDEFVPFDRVLARAANFVRTRFTGCVFSHVNFYAAVFEQADLSTCILDKCDLEACVFDQTLFRHSHVYRSDLVSATLCECVTDSAVFRSNDYFEWPTGKIMSDASWHLPRQLNRYVREEWDHFRKMPPEIRTDYTRQLVIRACVLLSVPMLALLAWRYVETNWIISMISAVGAMSTWAMRRYFTMALQGVMAFVLNKVNDAEGLWRAGLRKQAVWSLISSGMVRKDLRVHVHKIDRNL